MNKVPCAKCFGILGTESRMKIFSFLKANGKSSVSDIVDDMDLKQPTVSYHLNEMKKADLVKSTKEGKYVFYTLSSKCPYYSEECVLMSIKFAKEQYVKN